MIAASEPLEYIPWGRQAVEEHPGPATTYIPTSINKSSNNEHLLTDRMKNVNISSDDQKATPVFEEHWMIEELYEGKDLMSEYIVNSEHELFYKGHTAVWTRGIAGQAGVLSRTCFTCDTPICHAFFCSETFLQSNETTAMPKGGNSNNTTNKKPKGICLIDSKALRVYLNTGEDFLTSLEFPVSHTWQTRFGILLQKNASSAIISPSIAMPRLYSLSHPLDEMCPVLLRSSTGSVAYLTDSDYEVIFASATSQLVLMYEQKSGKHIISRLRKVTEEEANTISANDTLNPETTNTESMHSTSLLKGLGATTQRTNQSQPFFGGAAGGGKHSFHSFTNRTHSPYSQRPSINTPMTSAHLFQNLSNATSLGGGLSGLGSFTNRSGFANSPWERLHSTMGTSTLGVTGVGGGFGATSRISNMLAEMRKEGRAMPAKPIAPEWCLEHIWTEPLLSKEFIEAGSNGFFHTDLIGQRYMCFILVRSAQLQLVPLDGDDKVLESATVELISARDAIPLARMNMMVVLATCGTLILYSGATMVGKIHVGGVLSSFANLSTSFGASYPRRSSLLPTINSEAKFEEELHCLSPVHPLQSQLHSRNSGFCCGLRDPSGNRLTLIYPGGRMYRISIPLLSECPFVTKCLNALRAVLQPDLTLQLMIKWYGVRNAPGSRDLSPTQEWSMFRTVLLELIGRPIVSINSSLSNQSNTSSNSDEPKKRRKSENCLGTDEDWEFLVRHLSGGVIDINDSDNDGATAGTSHTLPMTSPRNNCNAPLFPHIPLVFKVLHLFYEEQKLSTMTLQLHMASLAEFLYQLAIDLQLECFSLHYFLDFPHLVNVQSGSFITEAETRKLLNQDLLVGEVPNVFKFINDLIVKRTVNSQYPYAANVNNRSRQLILLTYLLSTSKQIKYSKDDECIVMLLNETTSNDTTNPPGEPDNLAQNLSLRVVAACIRMKITRNVMAEFPNALQFMLSEGLEHSRPRPPIESGSDVCKLLLRADLVAHTNYEQDEARKSEPNRSFRNVKKEDSLSPKTPATPDVIPKTDVVLGDDGMEHIDTKLYQLRFPDDLRIHEARRVFASSKPVPIDIEQALGVSDHDFIDQQEKQLFATCVRTMALPVGRGMFTLRTVNPITTESLSIPKLCLSGKEPIKGASVELQQIEVPPNMSQWPLFHNGVAAGLQVTPNAKDIDSTWIVYNKPKGTQDGAAEHGGFLMALGLNGHLKRLSFMSIYEYLVKGEEMTSVGLLLGIAAAHRGSMDVTTTKMLSVHIEALLPATALELDIAQNIQVAAIMGIGLLYLSTGKRHMAEVLLQEIGRPPGPEMENCVERESYALTAGLALGMVTLCQGDYSTGLRDLQLPDALHYYMIGGNKRALSGSQREKYKLPSFQIREGDTVNIDVTAPGATLALGLMFFGTHNQAVANWMKPPETSYLLDLVRPDLLLLRVIARGLILWNDITPTQGWLDAQFPKGLNFGPPGDDPNVDHEANCQAYCNILAGAALLLGLRFAGTEDSLTLIRLQQIFDEFLNMHRGFMGEYAGRATVETGLVLSLLALSLVYAGTGHVSVFRACRMLRARIGTPQYNEVTYGSHMAIHMSLGFLFLGAGRFSLRRTPEAIASLICALFPKFPANSSDNRYHLQAFRHLYVFAVEPRMFIPRDIDTGKLVLCQLAYVLKDDEQKQVQDGGMAPIMLPDLDTLSAIEVVDANYWPVRFQRGKNWDQLEKILARTGCIDIKQKAGCLSRTEDPDRIRSELARSLTSERYANWMIDPKTFLSFSNDPRVENFTRIFMPKRPSTTTTGTTSKAQPLQPPSKAAKEEQKIEQFITFQFYNCVTKDRLHALPIYLNLLLSLQHIEKRASCADLWQIKIISSLLQRPTRTPNILLSSNILRSHVDRVNVCLSKWSMDYRTQLQQFLFSSNCTFLQDSSDATTLSRVAALITYYDLPMNVMNCVDVGSTGGQLNYLRLVMECKKLGLPAHTMNCISMCLRPSAL